MTTARRKAIDRLRRNARHREKLALVAALPETATREPDDRLRLIFTCCHPALDGDVQTALTLRAVAGLTTAEIARAFLLPEATLAKRLTRAKQKIVSAGIPYRTPEPAERRERLDQVLRVIYLVFNEGYLTTGGDAVARRELAHDAEGLAAMLVSWLPGEPEAMGLLSGRLPHRAGRRPSPARSVPAGSGHPGVALRGADPGGDRLAPAPRALLPPGRRRPSPVVLFSRAIVLGELRGPAAALLEVDALQGALATYHLFHATRASLLRRLDRSAEARRADIEALRDTANPAERAVVSARLES